MPASADAYDSLNIVTSLNYQHDSNLFRLPSGADVQSLLGSSEKSDDIISTSVTAKFSPRYSLQRFEFEAGLIDNRFLRYDRLDYTAKPYRAAWLWSLSPQFHGNLSHNRTQTLNSFADTGGSTNQNTRVDIETKWSGTYELSSDWDVFGGLSRVSTANSRETLGESDSRVVGIDAGLRYRFSSGSSVSLRQRQGDGAYTNRPIPVPGFLIDNGFTDAERELQMRWILGGNSTVDGRLARKERQHDNFAARDYAATVANANFNWNITGKLFLTTGLARDIWAYQTSGASYVVSDRVTIGPYWQISEQIGIRFRHEQTRRDYRGEIVAAPDSGRHDKTNSTRLAVEWTPLRSFVLVGSLQQDTRTSNKANLDYKSMITGLIAQLSF